MKLHKKKVAMWSAAALFVACAVPAMLTRSIPLFIAATVFQALIFVADRKIS